MIQSRRRFLVCVGIAVAGGATISDRGEVAGVRRRLEHPHDRAYGLIEDIDDRQLGEFLARNGVRPHFREGRLKSRASIENGA